jgi:hypothetical protein
MVSLYEILGVSRRSEGTDHGAVEPEVAGRLALDEGLKHPLGAKSISGVKPPDFQLEALWRGREDSWLGLVPGRR